METQPITGREYISLETPVFNIGLMLLLLENAHATALLSRVMNLVKEAVEHLNSNQTPVLTWTSRSSQWEKNKWLWPDPFSNNKYMIMTEMAGRVVEWFRVAKYNHNSTMLEQL